MGYRRFSYEKKAKEKAKKKPRKKIYGKKGKHKTSTVYDAKDFLIEYEEQD